jgi:hypothetical protein
LAKALSSFGESRVYNRERSQWGGRLSKLTQHLKLNQKKITLTLRNPTNYRKNLFFLFGFTLNEELLAQKKK